MRQIHLCLADTFGRLGFIVLLALSVQTRAGAADDLVFTPAPLSAPAAADIAASAPSLPAGRQVFAADNSHLARRKALDEYRLQLRKASSEYRPYDPALAELNLEAGRLYQELDLHEEALEHLGRAEHITRVNQGLFNTDQFESIALSVHSHLRQLDYATAVDRQEYLLYLHHRQYGAGDMQTLKVKRDLGNIYFDTFRRMLEGEAGARFPVLPYGEESGYQPLEKLRDKDKAFVWLSRAQKRYVESIHTMLEHKRFTDPLLMELETRYLRTMFLQANRRYLEYDPEEFLNSHNELASRSVHNEAQYRLEQQRPRYLEGIRSFERMLAYNKADRNTGPAAAAQTMMHLGDWHLLFGYRLKAEQTYADARQLLEAAGGQERSAGMLQPIVPVQLPFFGLLENTPEPDAAVSYEGFIDVAFKIHDDGRAADIEVLSTSGKVDESTEHALKRQIRRAPFRPRFTDTGELEEDAQVSVRYHVARL